MLECQSRTTSVLIGDEDQDMLYSIKIKGAQIRWRENPGVKIQRLERMSVSAVRKSVSS